MYHEKSAFVIALFVVVTGLCVVDAVVLTVFLTWTVVGLLVFVVGVLVVLAL